MSRKPETRKLEDLQQEYETKVVGLCLVCSKPVPAYYGMWQAGGTCSKKCEAIYEAIPKYPPPKGEGNEEIPDSSGST